MVWAAIGVLLLAVLGARRVLTRDERARHGWMGQEIEDDIRHLLFDCVYPGYAQGKVATAFWLQRKYLLWGRFVIVILVVADKNVRLSVEDMVVQRILSKMQEEEFLEAVVLPIFLWRVRKNGTRYRASRSSAGRRNAA